MNWDRFAPWLLGGVLAVIVIGTVGWLIGAAASVSQDEAESARNDSYETAYDQAYAAVNEVTFKKGLAAGGKRGRLAGQKTGSREGKDLGRSFASITVARDEADAAYASQQVAEAEAAERQANCGVLVTAPEACPTNAEVAAYRAAKAAANAAAAAPVEPTDDQG